MAMHRGLPDQQHAGIPPATVLSCGDLDQPRADGVGGPENAGGAGADAGDFEGG